MNKTINGIELVSTRSDISGSIDIGRITTGSAAMQCPLTREELSEHEFGFFAVPRLKYGSPAVGYVACKKIEVGKLPINDNSTEEWTAIVGGLYLLPEHRNIGIASRLVRTITQEIFDIEPDVSACIAQCNELSAPVFSRLGYESEETFVDTKVPYQVTRLQWQV